MLNLLEGYFLVNDFSNREKITFGLLKFITLIDDQWKNHYEKRGTKESTLLLVTPSQNSFKDVVKEQYYLVGSYEDKYIKWTTLWKERDQDVPNFTNISPTLRTKFGITNYEQHLVLMYRSCLYKYIQLKMEFLDISSLGATYQYAT